MGDNLQERLFEPYPEPLEKKLGGPLSVPASFIRRLKNHYGVKAYPLNEASGASFSGNGLPDGVISGTPTTYQAATNVPKSPQGLEIDHNSTLSVDNAVFDGLTGTVVAGGIFYYDGARFSSAGALGAYAVFVNKQSTFALYTSTPSRYMWADVYFSGDDNLVRSANYITPLRRPFFVLFTYNATTGTGKVYLNGVNVTTTSSTPTGTIGSTSDPVWFGNQNGTSFLLDGVCSLAIPPQNVTLTDKQIFDIAVELGLAQYGSNIHTDLGAGWSPYGNNTDDYTDGVYRITYVDNIAGALRYLRNTTDNNMSRNFATNEWFLLSFEARANAPSTSTRLTLANVSGGSSWQSPLFTDDWVTYEIVGQYQGSGIYQNFVGLSSGEWVELRNMQILPFNPTATIDLPYGPDLFDNGAGTFASGTYSWAAYGTNTIANVSNALEVTYVDNALGAFVLFRATSDLTQDLEIGKTYQFDAYVWVNTGSVQVGLSANGSTRPVIATITSTIPVKVSHTFVCASTTNCNIAFANMGAGEKVYITNMTLREVL